MPNDMQKCDATEIGRALGTRSPVAMEKEMQSPDSGDVAVGNAQVEAGAIGSMPSQRRRKLVKGALTAPVILTLYSGAALARTSNQVTVADNLEEATIGPADSPDDQGTAICAAPCAHPDAHETCDLGEFPTFSRIQVNTNNFNALQNQCAAKVEGGVIITASSATSLF